METKKTLVQYILKPTSVTLLRRHMLW